MLRCGHVTQAPPPSPSLADSSPSFRRLYHSSADATTAYNVSPSSMAAPLFMHLFSALSSNVMFCFFKYSIQNFYSLSFANLIKYHLNIFSIICLFTKPAETNINVSPKYNMLAEGSTQPASLKQNQSDYEQRAFINQPAYGQHNGMPACRWQ